MDIATGHKTGFYLDQRDSRGKFAAYTRRLGLKRVLNCYCYTGGFTVAALAGMHAAGGAGDAGHVTSIDSSAPALQRAQSNVLLNGFDAMPTDFIDADEDVPLGMTPAVRKGAGRIAAAIRRVHA